MDASTLFYLSKIANTYPGMAAAAAAAAAATTSPNAMVNNANDPMVNYDPAVLNSMAESYLRRFYTESLGLVAATPSSNGSLSTSSSSSDTFKSLNNSLASNSPINSSSSSSVSPTLLSPNTTHKTSKNGSITTTSPASSQSSSSSSSSTSSSKRSNYGFSNGDLLKSLSSQSSHQQSNNGSKFLIADILGLSGKVSAAASTKSPSHLNQDINKNKSLNVYTSETTNSSGVNMKKRPHTNSTRPSPVDSLSGNVTPTNIQDFQSQLANSFILNKIASSPQSNIKSHNQSQHNSGFSGVNFANKSKHANELSNIFHQNNNSNNNKNVHETFFVQQNLNVNNSSSSTPLKLPCQNNKNQPNKTSLNSFTRGDPFEKNNDDGNESIYDDDQDLDSDQGI